MLVSKDNALTLKWKQTATILSLSVLGRTTLAKSSPSAPITLLALPAARSSQQRPKLVETTQLTPLVRLPPQPVLQFPPRRTAPTVEKGCASGRIMPALSSLHARVLHRQAAQIMAALG